MNGLELSRGYFEEFGRPVLEKEFADILEYIAVGFTGSGSEHYGFDDEISRDHDYEPGFCIFLPDEDIVDRRTAFLLERAYSKLPKEYMGAKKQLLSPVGGGRNGVFRTADFYQRATGTPDGRLSAMQWLKMPDYALSEAVNGEIFLDNPGEVTAIRKRLKEMPRDIMLKRIAGNLLLAAQAGQYNFSRCVSHVEYEAAALAAVEFVKAAMKVIFLLHGEYMPYYKWSFRALRGIEGEAETADDLSFILLGDCVLTDEKQDRIEKVSSHIISMLIDKELTGAICGDLEKHAYSVNDKITDGELRNMHILAAVGD